MFFLKMTSTRLNTSRSVVVTFIVLPDCWWSKLVQEQSYPSTALSMLSSDWRSGRAAARNTSFRGVILPPHSLFRQRRHSLSGVICKPVDA
jgi:hypothetical protein